jgi:peptide/nickel transport system substrate-binding protein
MKRLLGAVLLITLTLSACQRFAKPEPAILIFARGADSQKLDPADVDDGESMKVLVNVCEGLVRFKHGTTEPEPCLATSWIISPDGLAYTFRLRPGVEFHDGPRLFAEGVAFVRGVLDGPMLFGPDSLGQLDREVHLC